jgi:hypothetical protein
VITPDGYDDSEQVPCPECGATLDVGWVDVTSLTDRSPRFVLGSLTCPTSRIHNLAAAYHAMKVVEVAHDREGTGTCTLNSLGRWREQGWYPVDWEHQTSTEAVQAFVREMRARAELGVVEP